MKLSGRHNIAAFALNRFDDNRGDFLRRDGAPEQVFKLLNRLMPTCRSAAIGVWIIDVADHRNQRREAAALHDLAAGERERAERAAMKGAKEGDHVLPARVIPS